LSTKDQRSRQNGGKEQANDLNFIGHSINTLDDNLGPKRPISKAFFTIVVVKVSE